MSSLWEKTADIGSFNRLENDISTDVLIIGGGLAGILCAYMLEKTGVDYILVEADRLCSGITKNTTAKITSQHGLLYDKLIREFDTATAGLYLRANQEALQRYRQLCANIDCHFEEKDNFVYSVDSRSKIDKEIAALKTLGFPAQRLESVPLPVPVAGAVKFIKQAQFNPMQFVSGIAKGLCIYEHTPVRELIGTTAATDRGRITANRIIVATHFPFLNKHGGYFLKMFQHRSYVIALENAPQVNGMYVDEAPKGLSFRNYENLLLLGGGDHRTGKKRGGWQELRAFAARHYPGAVEKYHWATQDCITLDGMPYIGRYASGTENLYVATGFNKWGMTSSMVAAALLTDMVRDKSNPYQAVFDPTRTMLRPQLAVNAAEATANLLTPRGPRCPHLGCALKWNSAERTWDCPCHGSRFAEDGELIDNPATGDLKKR